MSTTRQQDKEFQSAIENEVHTTIDQTILEVSIEWIKENLSPEDVFDDKQLGEWAENNNYKLDL